MSKFNRPMDRTTRMEQNPFDRQVDSIAGAGSSGLVSPFDLMVLGLLPQVFNDMQDETFDSLQDVSGNNRHATALTAVHAEAGAAMRSTRSQSVRFPYATGVTANKPSYQVAAAGAGIAATFVTSGHAVIQLSFKRSVLRNVAAQKMAGATLHDASSSSGVFWLAVSNSDDGLYSIVRSSGGGYPIDGPAPVSDNTTRIVTSYINKTTNRRVMYVDGVAYAAGTWAADLSGWAYPYLINATDAPSYDLDEWFCDHHAMWCGGAVGAIPTETQIQEMHAAYLAEVL